MIEKEGNYTPQVRMLVSEEDVLLSRQSKKNTELTRVDQQMWVVCYVRRAVSGRIVVHTID